MGLAGAHCPANKGKAWLPAGGRGKINPGHFCRSGILPAAVARCILNPILVWQVMKKEM
jgi:hypothetical protein